MTVRKQEPWGEPGVLPSHGVVVSSDREVSLLVAAARRAGEPIPPLGLVGGDLCRTLGGRGDESRLHSPDAMTFTVDVGSVLIDGGLHWFVAHLVAKRSWWWGRAVVAMNAEYLGDWDVAPKGHPNDGYLEVLDGDLALGQRLEARRRLPLGSHLPHPDIAQRRVQAIQIEFDRPMPVELDGERMGVARTLSMRVEADALLCVV